MVYNKDTKGDYNMDIGEKIKTARIAKGMTQAELGELLGVQKSAVAKYEKGRVVNIKRSTLKKMSDILGLHPAELISEEEQKNNDIQADIVIRMRTDTEFMETVEMLNALNPQKLPAVKQFLSVL